MAIPQSLIDLINNNLADNNNGDISEEDVRDVCNALASYTEDVENNQNSVATLFYSGRVSKNSNIEKPFLTNHYVRSGVTATLSNVSGGARITFSNLGGNGNIIKVDYDNGITSLGTNYVQTSVPYGVLEEQSIYISLHKLGL